MDVSWIVGSSLEYQSCEVWCWKRRRNSKTSFLACVASLWHADDTLQNKWHRATIQAAFCHCKVSVLFVKLVIFFCKSWFIIKNLCLCRSVKVVKPIHCDALYGFDKDYFFFLCCSCLALFYICNVIQTSDLDKDDSASGPLLRFVSAMVTACKCHGYGL